MMPDEPPANDSNAFLASADEKRPPREDTSHQRGPLSQLANEIREINRANGWQNLMAQQWDEDHKVPALLALIHSELSEALEAFRKNDQEHFLEEMADVVIRVLDCVGGLTDDFDRCIDEKLQANRRRSQRHGGKRI